MGLLLYLQWLLRSTIFAMKLQPLRLLVDIFLYLNGSRWTAFEPFPLVTIPLFILVGQLMEHGGMSDKLVTIKKLVGAYKGGPAWSQ